MGFGPVITERRKQLGLTLAALGERIGVTQEAIRLWEADIRIPDIDRLPAIAAALEVDIADLARRHPDAKKLLAMLGGADA